MTKKYFMQNEGDSTKRVPPFLLLTDGQNTQYEQKNTQKTRVIRLGEMTHICAASQYCSKNAEIVRA